MKYKNRYSDKAEQNFYKNCCDCLRYGYGFRSVVSCGENETKRKEIWKQALHDITTSF